MKNFLKNNKFFFLGFLILSWIIFVNIFPEGYVFGGGDTTQLLEPQDSFQNLFFNWNLSACLFYFIFFILGKIGISNATQLSFYLGFIIFGAYISFGFFSWLIFKSSDKIRTLVSLFYALNLYTLFLFTGNWGYSYFPSLYIFIPILIGLFLKFLKNNEFIYGAFFCIALAFSSSGFGNPAFAISFVLLLFLLTLSSITLKITTLNRKFLINIFFITFFSFLVSLYWILPIIPQMKAGVESVVLSEVLEFNHVIRIGSASIFNIFSLVHPSEIHFPVNFYYKNFDYLKNTFISLSFIPILLIITSLFFAKNFKSKKLYFLLIILLSIFTILISKLRPPFEILNYYIYHIPGFQTMRGFDKTAIYFPFFIATLILIFLQEVKNKKWIYTLLIISLILPLPFYIGKIQQNAGYRVSSKKDYKTAPMSFLIKVPSKYYSIRNLINIDPKKSTITSLPYSYNDGSGIVNYPKWNLYGADITHYLYNKNLINANNFRYIFSNWDFAKEFNDDYSEKYNWVIKTLGLMNSKYLIFHKDAPEESIRQSEFKIRILEKEGLIKNLEENDYFILYEINKDYFFPYISWQKENIQIEPSVRSINKKFDKIKDLTTNANFQEINPKKYIVNFENNEFSKNIVLAEPFNNLWKAYYITNSGKEIEVKDHFLARGYANGWNLEKRDDIKKVLIEYYPTRLMWKGIWVSGITILFLIGYLLKYYYDNKKRIL